MKIKDVIIGLVLMLGVGLFFAIISSIIQKIYGDTISTETLKTIPHICYIPTMFATLLYFWRVKNRVDMNTIGKPSKLNFGNIKLYYVVVGMIITLCADVIISPLYDYLPQSEYDEYRALFMGGELYTTMFISIICAPIFEEIIFRGYILQGLSQKYGNLKSIIYTSLMFSLIHFSVIQSPNAFIISLVWCSIYLLSNKSLTTVIILHIINNLCSFSILYIEDATHTSIKDIIIEKGGNFTYIYIIAAIIFILFIALVALKIDRFKISAKEQSTINN